MGIGTSIFLIAVGAILDFAIDVNTQGVNLHTVGAILMIVGAIGVVLSLVFWSSWGGIRTNRTVVETVPRRRVYEDELL